MSTLLLPAPPPRLALPRWPERAQLPDPALPPLTIRRLIQKQLAGALLQLFDHHFNYTGLTVWSEGSTWRIGSRYCHHTITIKPGPYQVASQPAGNVVLQSPDHRTEQFGAFLTVGQLSSLIRLQHERWLDQQFERFLVDFDAAVQRLTSAPRLRQVGARIIVDDTRTALVARINGSALELSEFIPVPDQFYSPHQAPSWQRRYGCRPSAHPTLYSRLAPRVDSRSVVVS